jgi:hypothetical protein
MTKRLSVLCVVATVTALVAGCGGSSKKSSTSTPSSSSAATSSTSTPSSSSGGTSTNSAAAQAAKQGCESAINSNAALAASKRSALSADCQKVADAAASGNKTKYKSAYLSFCNDLAGALPSAAQAATKSACQQTANAIQ